MGELKNLSANEAIEKLKDLAEDIRICMFCTQLSSHPISARPMNVQEVDQEGNLWFISPADSNKNYEINNDNRVQLFFCSPKDSEYLSVYGTAYEYRDQATIEDKWSPMARAWFDEGKDDPNVAIIRVTPSDAYYWDTQNGKIVAMVKIMTAAVTGKGNDDDSVEGSINI